MNVCRCGVTTLRRLCYFCTRTEALRPRGAWRRLTPSQEATIRASGASPAQLARQYGVSQRTIYRVLGRRLAAFERLELAGYHAEFEVTDDGPRQRSGWRSV